MHATRLLPPNAKLVYTWSLHQNRKALWALQFVGLLLFFLFGALFLWITVLLRPDLHAGNGIRQFFSPFGNPLSLLLGLVGIAALTLVLHEAIHGLFFWLFTRSRPVFGFRVLYAFAGAPGWYLARTAHLANSLAPLIIITVLGLPLLAVVPINFLPAVLWGLLVNASGAVGDLWVAFIELRQKGILLVEDLGAGFNFYALA